MTGISRRRLGRASWVVLAAIACGGRSTDTEKAKVGPQSIRIIPFAQAIVLETSGPPVADTSVTFTSGFPRTIILRHGTPGDLVFAELTFPPAAFADSGQPVQVSLKPRPGLYGMDVRISVSLKTRAVLVFKYPRYFRMPAKAQSTYRGHVAFEQALAIGQMMPGDQLAMLPSTRPASDNLSAEISGGGTYLVAAPR
jgi:hypothetical protein